MVEETEDDTIYHVATAADWAEAQNGGLYHGGALCRQHGYVHFSTAEQLPDTLARFFAGRGDLILISARSSALGPALRWETAPDGGVFPHLHAPLLMEHVLAAEPLSLALDVGDLLRRGGRSR